MDSSSVKVTCLQVSSPKEKIQKLFNVVYHYYNQGNKLLLKSDSQETSEYLDRLLWEHPKESFLPHSLDYSSTSFLCISALETSPSDIYAIFNFTKKPIIPTASVTKIYELEDLTSSERKKIFEGKYRFYSDQGYHLISL
jgi:DNA polymerase IIIc chi subunit